MRSIRVFTTALLVAGLSAGLLNCLSNNPDVRGLPKNNAKVIIGDSIFALSGVEKLELARNAGENSRGYARSGATLPGIINQYGDAKGDGAIRTIVMDGGGNNVLIGNKQACTTDSVENLSQTCLNVLYTAFDQGTGLLITMNNDGVQDILWQGYYELPRGNAGLNSALAVGNAGLQDICEDSIATCHFVDLVQPVRDGGGPAALVKSDNIHPTDPGSKVLADAVWARMVELNIEQNQ